MYGEFERLVRMKVHLAALAQHGPVQITATRAGQFKVERIGHDMQSETTSLEDALEWAFNDLIHERKRSDAD